MKYIIGNWKANKTASEVISWSDDFLKEYIPDIQTTFIVCPPSPYLSALHDKLSGKKNVFLGAQTVSTSEGGSYTGEVTAQMIRDTAQYVIVGHSERRKYYLETDEELSKKVLLAKKYALEPIYCVRDEKDSIPDGVRFVAYEPVAAIGTGQNEPPEKVVEMKKKMSLPQGCIFIYGGSVNERNCSSYISTGEIDGFLIGKASLSPSQFLLIGKG